jgi:hypothetical protein
MRALGQKFFKNYNGYNSSHKLAVDRLIEFEKRILLDGIHSHHAYFIGRCPCKLLK